MPVKVFAALGAGWYAEKSVLSSGKWVRIKVRGSGMHQVTDSELREMGFADPGKVAVYGYPATMLADNMLTDNIPDDLPPLPFARYGDKLVFYAEGDVSLHVSRHRQPDGSGKDFTEVKRNYFADYGIYFLTDSHPGKQIAELPYESSGQAAAAVSHGMAHFEEEFQNPGAVGARYIGPDCVATGGGSWQIEIPGFNGDGVINTRVLLGARNDEATWVYFTLFGKQQRIEAVSSRSEETYGYGIDKFDYVLEGVERRPDGSYNVKLDFAGVPSGIAALEYVTAFYPRDNRLDGRTQSMFVFPGDAREVEFACEGMDLAVWEVTHRESPVALETVAATGGRIHSSLPEGCCAGVPGTAEHKYVMLFNPAATLLPVEYAGEVNCPDLHASPTPHMLVVASRDFMPHAERIAELHREADGLDVVVVSQDDVYNEFSSGTPHLMAVRRLARMYRDRDPAKFRSILLFGPAHYDSRGLAVDDKEDFHNHYLPMFICEEAEMAGHMHKSYATDAFVGMLDEDEGKFDIRQGKMSVAVGRIPAKSALEADSYIGKVERYVAHPPVGAFHNRAVLICDSGNENGHMKDADEMAGLIAECSPATTVFKAYNPVYPVEGKSAKALRKKLVSALSDGVCFLGYSGHGSPKMFAPEELWSVGMAEGTDYDVPPFAMLASCRALYIDHPGRSTGTAMLFKNHGGAIAVAGALREVYKVENQVLNLCVGREFFSAAKGSTAGEVFMRARNAVIGQAMQQMSSISREKLQLNTLCYNLAGDPEVMIPVAGRQVVITHAGGVELPDDAALKLEAGGEIAVEGAVMMPGGGIDAGFDGYGIISVYDGAKELKVINGTAEEKKGIAVLDEDLIYEKRLRITSGRFSDRLYIPLPSRPSHEHRVSMWAVSDDGLLQGTGFLGGMSISPGDYGSKPVEGQKPEIKSVYIGSPGFRDGDLVCGSPVVYAEVSAGTAGVAGFSTIIGQSLLLSLDGGKKVYDDAYRYFHSDENGGGVLEFNLGHLHDGRHSLTLRVTDYAGRSDSRTIMFTVVDRGAEASLGVDEYPAITEATFRLEHTFPSEPTGRIVVADGEGRVVFTDDDASFPYTWNLCRTDGGSVSEGVYMVSAYLKAGGVYGSAPPVEVVVSRD